MAAEAPFRASPRPPLPVAAAVRLRALPHHPAARRRLLPAAHLRHPLAVLPEASPVAAVVAEASPAEVVSPVGVAVAEVAVASPAEVAVAEADSPQPSRGAYALLITCQH